MTLAEFNALGAADAERGLRACCDVPEWVRDMTDRRPYKSFGTLLAWADTSWRRLGPDAWREMFDGHPRIGGADGHSPRGAGAASRQRSRWPKREGGSARARLWSAGEQSRAADADEDTRAALVAINREYEERFGHIFLTCAMGKSAPALLAEARARLENPPARELEVAAEEQRKIMRLRLRRWFGGEEGTEA